MNQTGNKSVQMVRRYIRDGSLLRENSAGRLGAIGTNDASTMVAAVPAVC